MTDTPGSYKRNLFEVDNARNLNPRELVETFVPTTSFWRLLSAKHHVVLGARGSGKTALAKMLSHDHLAMLQHPRAQSAIREQQFIGVYIPTRLEWVGALKNKPWQSTEQKELFFQWRLNLASCLALITTVDSCLGTYCGDKGERTRTELALASELADAWADGARIDTLGELKKHLLRVEYEKHVNIARARANGEQFPSACGPGIKFDTDLFVPLKRGMTLTAEMLRLRAESTWLVCLDEAEFLEELHHRIINSHMRAHSGNVFFKITTMPYCHYTLATNTDVPLDVGHDFDYVYIDSDPALFAKYEGETNSIGTRFARTLFKRRLDASGLREVAISDVLGPSALLDDKDESWSRASEEFKLLQRYGSEETIVRAERLVGTARFKPEVSRKLHSALLLRRAYDEAEGRAETDIYSGTSLAIRCGDGNPRRLIRIFSGLVSIVWRLMHRGRGAPRIPPRDQSRVLRRLSTSALVRVQSEPQCGAQLYAFLGRIGDYMSRALHQVPLTTDQVSSIRIERSISDEKWSWVQRAVELGLLYPNIGPQQRDEMPNREGKFHLAFVLAPHFFLLPRRGHARSLDTILAVSGDARQMELELKG